MDSLKTLMTPDEYEEMKYSGLLNKIESGQTMPDYLQWLKGQLPELDITWKHIVYIGEHIDKLMRGEIRKLMISTPPRHGKSQCVTIPLPVYYLAKNPQAKIILASYNQTLADKFSGKCRTLALSANLELHPTKRQRNDWETTEGGGVRAVGAITAGIAGYGADLMLVDDPVRNRKDANSVKIMEDLYHWYTDDIYTRLEQDVKMVMIATRWHENDLFGRILGHEGEYSEDNPIGWVVINLPALAEDDDVLGREVGEALCPERFNREALLEIKQSMGRGFEALFQGRPTQQEGDIFKLSWFKFVDELPREDIKDLRFYRYWDTSSSAGRGDYTVGCLLAHNTITKHIYIVDIVRGQWSSYDRNNIMLKTAKADKFRWGDVRVRFEVEGGASGIDAKEAIVKLLQGFSVKGVRSRTNKILRAEPLSAQTQGGNVSLIKAAWNRDYLQEMTSFPNGKYDDQVDASSGAFNEAVVGNSFIFVGGQRIG